MIKVNERDVAGAQKKSLPQNSYLKNLLRELHVHKRQPGSLLMANIIDALRVFKNHRLRSSLTVLSIFVGVAAMIVTIIWMQGTNASLTNQLINLGTNVISITPGSTSNSNTSQVIQPLTLSDAQSLQSVPHVVTVSPVISVSGVQVVSGNKNWNTDVSGVSTDFQEMQNWQLASGVWFNSMQETGGEPVAVLGDTVVHQLFPGSGSSPIHQQILIGNKPFRVIGVLAPRGGGASLDDVIFVPFHSAFLYLKNTVSLDQIEVQANSINNITAVQNDIDEKLRQNHHIINGMPDDFTILTATQLIQNTQLQIQLMTLLSIGIAGLSLMVAGIGIMNIMLVSVTERTREIGIRMSIGARQRDIRNQFLLEALVLCFSGGFMGLVCGILVGWVITLIAGLPFVMDLGTFILPFIISTAIVLIFGLSPAKRASRLDPIKAIRGAV
jgi:putative ABC transport system permease protein